MTGIRTDNRLSRLEERVEALEALFGRGPHTLVAKDGRMAFCGGPQHCQACDEPRPKQITTPTQEAADAVAKRINDASNVAGMEREHAWKAVIHD